jgi:DNA modification methylase
MTTSTQRRKAPVAKQLKLFTNEEKRVRKYQSEPAPTLPESVTPSTNPAKLNLNWRERDLPERERTKHVHRLHPYLGKFIPQLVEIFLRMYFKPGDTVFDPFCGSGTTLVEANGLSIHSVGCDISQFNCLLSSVKTQKYDTQLAEKEVLDILERTREASQPSLFQKRNGRSRQLDTSSYYLRQWYAPAARRELLTYLSFIEDYKYPDLLRVILSRAARSARLTTHFDLDFPKKPQTQPYQCYKHSRICQPVQEAMGFLRRYSLDTIRRIKEFAHLRTEAEVHVLCGDAREIVLPRPINGIITSPPYVGLIDYHEQHRYAYELLGLPDNRGLEIGAAVRGSSRSAKQEYQHAITEVFRNAWTFLRPGDPAIVVVHDKHSLYPEISDNCGFSVEHVIERHVNRRTGRRAGEFFEQIYVWRRQ